MLARVGTHVNLRRTALELVERNRRLEEEIERHRLARQTIDYLREEIQTELNFDEIVGKAERANQLFERYVNDYPTDERSKQLFFRIASNYAAVLELDEAIRYYEELARNFPTYQDTPAALYNAAFLRIGVGDYEGAARGLERYAALDQGSRILVARWAVSSSSARPAWVRRCFPRRWPSSCSAIRKR